MDGRRAEGADWPPPLARERRILRDGAVAVADGRIVAVGKTDDIARDHPAQRVISARGKVVTPGLAGSHIPTTFPTSPGCRAAGHSRPRLPAEVAGAAGVRCVVARSRFDVAASAMGVLPPAFIETTEQALARAERVVEELHGAHGGGGHARGPGPGRANTGAARCVGG